MLVAATWPCPQNVFNPYPADHIFLAPAVTVGETEGAMYFASVLDFTSSFA